MDEVYPIEQEDVEQAKTLLLGSPTLSARDAVHVGVMKRRDVARVMSFEAGFDQVGWIDRLC